MVGVVGGWGEFCISVMKRLSPTTELNHTQGVWIQGWVPQRCQEMMPLEDTELKTMESEP